MAGHAPYGYIKNPDDKHFFIIDTVAAEVVKKIYNKKKGSITDTLATKILLGTLACLPAYDVYFTKAINKYKSGAGTLNMRSIEALVKFYDDNKESLNNLLVEFEKDGVKYPQMKLLDMGFFEYGMKL